MLLLLNMESSVILVNYIWSLPASWETGLPKTIHMKLIISQNKIRNIFGQSFGSLPFKHVAIVRVPFLKEIRWRSDILLHYIRFTYSYTFLNSGYVQWIE